LHCKQIEAFVVKDYRIEYVRSEQIVLAFSQKSPVAAFGIVSEPV